MAELRFHPRYAFIDSMKQAVRENGDNGCSVWKDSRSVIACYDESPEATEHGGGNEFATFSPQDQAVIVTELDNWLAAGKIAEAAGDMNWCHAN